MILTSLLIKYNETGFKYCGFINITELGFGRVKNLNTTGNYNYNPLLGLLEIRTINGYQFNYNFSLGIGTGINIIYGYGGGILFPVTLDARFVSNEGKTSAVLLLSAGMALNSPVYPIYIFQPSLGIRHYVSEKRAFLISLGPKIILQENARFIRNLTGKDFFILNAMTLNAGFSF
jgi:hypothetical protein